MPAQGVDRGPANIQVLTRSVVLCNVLYGRRSKPKAEGQPAGTCLAGRLFAASLFGAAPGVVFPLRASVLPLRRGLRPAKLLALGIAFLFAKLLRRQLLVSGVLFSVAAVVALAGSDLLLSLDRSFPFSSQAVLSWSLYVQLPSCLFAGIFSLHSRLLSNGFLG